MTAIATEDLETLEGAEPTQAHRKVETKAFAELDAVLEKWFYKPDLQGVRIVLGTIKAHYLKTGDPAWLFLVAPPGTGKTTMSIMGSSGLPEVVPLGEFTENTFLSGFHGAKEPGLLEKLGPTSQDGTKYTTQGNAVFLAKDFTTVLSMRHERRSVILGQLREIHDGQFKKDFGTGTTKIWNGRVTMVAAVTPALDRHNSVFSTLGERFLQVRWHRPDSPEAGEWAIRQQGQEAAIREDTSRAVKAIVDRSLKEAPELSSESQKRLASLAEVVAIGRTHVSRNGYGSREIEYVPEPESNTRISKGLAAIARGLAALNGREKVGEPDIQDALRVGLDCLPPNRKELLLTAFRSGDPASLGLARTVRERELEELEALRLLEAEPSKAEERKLTPNTKQLLHLALRL